MKPPKGLAAQPSPAAPVGRGACRATRDGGRTWSVGRLCRAPDARRTRSAETYLSSGRPGRARGLAGPRAAGVAHECGQA